MKVYEYKVKIRLKQDLEYCQLSEKTSYFIDSVLTENSEFLAYHTSRQYKGYVHDLLYPVEETGIYERNKVYVMRIRLVEDRLAQYLLGNLSFHETKELQGVGGEIKIIPKRVIQRVYSITPAILKSPGQGYWKGHMSLEEFEKRLKENLIKKYKFFSKNDIEESFTLYDLIEFKNKVPVKILYKNITLLGDKIVLEIASNKQAQELAYLALGVGLLENNSRGFGFVNFKYM